MKSLTEENFWNELQATFPEQMKMFSDWIDEYKVRVKWIFLFSGDEIKFHHLPLEMQTGIVYLFFKEAFQMTMIPMFDVTDDVEVVQTIKDVFSERFMKDQFARLDVDENLKNDQL